MKLNIMVIMVMELSSDLNFVDIANLVAMLFIESKMDMEIVMMVVIVIAMERQWSS